MGPDDEEGVGGLVDDGPKGGEPEFPGFGAGPLYVSEVHRHGAGLDRYRTSVEEIRIGVVGVPEERVELIQIRVVVGGGEAQAMVEAADGGEGPAQSEIAVEVQDARHPDMG